MWIRCIDVMKHKPPVKLTNTLLSPTKQVHHADVCPCLASHLH